MLTGVIRYGCRAAVVVAALLLINASLPVTAQTTGTVSDAPSPKGDAVEKLRQGGYVVYLRHTQTDSKTEDRDLSDMSNCANQRVLSTVGRENATKLGEAFRALAIPLGDVITSQFCRAKDTARLMNLEITKETADLNNDSGEPFVTKEESARRGAALRKLLATAPARGKNTLIVGHVPNVRNALSLEYATMKEGEVALFTAKGGEPGFELVTRITQDELQSIAKLAAK
jgi:phosphohistidine phosphatase SixA